MITFSQSSLGFMCNFEFEEHRQVIDSLICEKQGQLVCEEKLGVEERFRLKVNTGPGTNINRKIYRGDQLENSEDIVIEDLHVLNEVVIDKGPSPYSLDLNLYIDDNFITAIKGDGVIIATATGSTAYNLSAGGSILQTAAKSICITPLAPCSLSFRPIILTPDVTIRIEKVANNRGVAWAALDGANRIKLD